MLVRLETWVWVQLNPGAVCCAQMLPKTDPTFRIRAPKNGYPSRVVVVFGQSVMFKEHLVGSLGPSPSCTIVRRPTTQRISRPAQRAVTALYMLSPPHPLQTHLQLPDLPAPQRCCGPVSSSEIIHSHARGTCDEEGDLKGH